MHHPAIHFQEDYLVWRANNEHNSYTPDILDDTWRLQDPLIAQSHIFLAHLGPPEVSLFYLSEPLRWPPMASDTHHELQQPNRLKNQCSEELHCKSEMLAVNSTHDLASHSQKCCLDWRANNAPNLCIHAHSDWHAATSNITMDHSAEENVVVSSFPFEIYTPGLSYA